MAVTYSPLQVGDPPQLYGNGVVSGLQVTQDSGMDISVTSGEAVIYGDFENDSTATLTVASNSSGNTRYDLVVARVEVGTTTASLAIKTGNLNPQQDSTIWELPLAMITVVDSASSITSGNIQDLRIFYGDLSNKLLVDVTNSTDYTIGAGQEKTLAFNTVTTDLYRYGLLGSYLSPRVTAWYNVEVEMQWLPASATTKPIVFSVYTADGTTFMTKEIYRISSAQTSAGAVTFSFDRNFLLNQGDFLYVSVKNTSDVDIDVKSVASTSPLFKLYIQSYPHRS
jgi:hypothetical protein